MCLLNFNLFDLIGMMQFSIAFSTDVFIVIAIANFQLPVVMKSVLLPPYSMYGSVYNLFSVFT